MAHDRIDCPGCGDQLAVGEWEAQIRADERKRIRRAVRRVIREHVRAWQPVPSLRVALWVLDRRDERARKEAGS